MALAIFDLDDTLLAGDSASLWLEYMVNTGIAPFSMLATEQAMMQQYRKGALDMSAYLDFTFAPLRGLSVSEIQERVEQFVTHMIAPRIYPEGMARLDWHRQRGDIPLLISASPAHIVHPIARLLGIEHSLAIELETRDDCYTGQSCGTLTYREGKVIRLQQWLTEHPAYSIERSFGYSDSRNDIPLLSATDRPYVINPDRKLHSVALAQGWTVLCWNAPV